MVGCVILASVRGKTQIIGEILPNNRERVTATTASETEQTREIIHTAGQRQNSH